MLTWRGEEDIGRRNSKDKQIKLTRLISGNYRSSGDMESPMFVT